MNKVSPCHLAPIEKGTKPEYPDGGNTWYISRAIDVCADCGGEVEYTLLQDEVTGNIVSEVYEESPLHAKGPKTDEKIRTLPVHS